MAKPSSLTLLTLFTLLATFFSSGFADNILYTNEILSGGSSLTYASYRLTMQTDCNLVLYDNNRAIWSSGTYNRASGCFLKMQRDGNLVIYSNRGAVWASGTNVGNGNYVLVLQRDRNVVIYGSSLWATATNLYGIGVTINPLKKNSTA